MELRSLNGIEVLTSNALWEGGIRHGFLGKPYTFPGEEKVVAAAFGADCALFLKQIHGDQIFVFKDRSNIGESLYIGEGDGALFPIRKGSKSGGILVGARGADCMPIILIDNAFGGVLHIGWRGLANRILPKAVSELNRLDPGAALTILIGPCAGAQSYQVGREVLDAIGEGVVFKQNQDGCILDLAETAKSQAILSGIDSSKIILSQICTMTDSRYHSFRRDGEKAGRNVGFLLGF